MGSLLSGNDLEPEPLIDGLEDSSKKPPLLQPLIRGNGGPDLDLVGAPVPRVAVAEAKRQLILGAPIAGMNVLNFMMQLVSIIFVGHLGALPLAGAAMSASLSNVTGFAVLEGLASAMETMCGQAYGAEQHRQLGLILQRVQLILLICCIPIAAVFLNCENVLLWVGQDPAIAAVAQEYSICLLPGLFGAALYMPLAKFMQAQGVMTPLAIIAAIALCFHVIANWIGIYCLGWGYRGAALAYSATDFVELILMVLYLKYVDKSGVLERSWCGWSFRNALQGWPSFFALAIPAAVMTCLEWWFFTSISIMSGWLPNPDATVGAMAICFQTAGVCYMLPLGLGTAVSVRVSNELGAGRPGWARCAVQVAVAVALVTGGTLALLLLLLRRHWALLFADESETAIIDLVTQLMPSLVVSQLGIGLIAVLAGVLRGSGQQVVGSLVNGTAFYALALPASAMLAFWPLHLGLEGLWWGLMLGVLLQIVIISCLTAMTDWSHQVVCAENRLRTEMGGGRGGAPPAEKRKEELLG